MNKWVLLSLALTAAILVLINLMPTNKGVMLYCQSGMEQFYRPQETHGFPMTYVKTNRIGSDCFRVNDISGKADFKQDPKKYNNYFFSPFAILVDGAVAVSVLGFQTFSFVRYKRGEHE